MKKTLIGVVMAGLLHGSPALAQENPGVLNLLLAGDGVVPSLLETLTTFQAEPLVSSVAGADGGSGLIRGNAGVALNGTLAGLLQDPFLDLGTTLDGVGLLVIGDDTRPGLVPNLLMALTGDGSGLGGGLLGGDGGGLPLVGGLLGGDGGLPLIGGLLGGDDGGLPLIGDLFGGDGGLPLIGGLLGGGLATGGAGGLPLNSLPLPLSDLDPATALALVNGATLEGL
ncbi:hypothetical protein [Spectribacter hydrogenoxidans]|uniref:Uncharacterized protein n=1 Tax=Spectribacter hydrogenoxidans TaxID=3075608 RepID=A0ABU3C051_9GAMM|nr:hypothetical protein [Salinisphaera sp. W335]MDT0634932.1 hypothetical protein [Salinisphaera sp. W335]